MANRKTRAPLSRQKLDPEGHAAECARVAAMSPEERKQREASAIEMALVQAEKQGDGQFDCAFAIRTPFGLALRDAFHRVMSGEQLDYSKFGGTDV